MGVGYSHKKAQAFNHLLLSQGVVWGTEWCLRGEVSKAFNYHYIGLDSYKIFSTDGSARVLWNKVLLEDSSRNFGGGLVFNLKCGYNKKKINKNK